MNEDNQVQTIKSLGDINFPMNDFMSDIRVAARPSDDALHELKLELQGRLEYLSEQFVGMKATPDVLFQMRSVLVGAINSFLSEKELILWHGVDKKGYGGATQTKSPAGGDSDLH